MNHRILKLLRLLGAPLLAAAAVFGSCMTELESNPFPPSGGNGKGEQEVLLKLHVPGTTSPGEKGGTRAVDADEEEQIDDVYILAFKADADESNDSYDYWVSAKKGANNATWTALLKVKDYDQRFIVIANAMQANGGLVAAINSLKPGEKSKEEIKKLLTVTLTDDEKTSGFNAAGTNNHSAFTMCGETAPTKITADGNSALNVSLYRIVARIQVYFGDKAGTGLENFTPSTVRLYNFNDKAQVIPDELGSKVTQTTIPADAALQKGEAKYTVTGNKLKHSIYLFETAQPDNMAPDSHVNRPCLVVGGKYNGGNADKYYRVDLGTPKADTGNKELDYLDILRNHSYEITVTSVSGEGHDTEQGALESKSANMTAEVIPWDETEIGNIDFDGEKFLGIGTMEYRVGKMGSENLIQKVAASTGLEWTATLLNSDGQGNPDWIKFVVDGTEQTGTGGTGAGADSPADVQFKVAQKDTPEDRVAIMRFTAGHLQIDAKVIQDDSNPVFIDTPEETIEFDGAENDTRSFDITFGPENTTLTWEVVDGNMPITFVGTPTIDGKTDGNAGTESGATGRKLVVANFTAQAIQGEVSEKKTATLRLIAKNDNGDITAKSVRLSQIKRVLNLSKNTVITDGKEQKIYVDANFDWSVKMENAADIEGEFINTFEQDQTGQANAGGSSEQSVVKLTTIASTEFDLDEKTVTLTFTDRATGKEIPKTITIAKGYTYNGRIYHVLDGGEKTLSKVLAKDRKLANGEDAPAGYDYAPLGLCLQLAPAVRQNLWHSGTQVALGAGTNAVAYNITFDNAQATLYMSNPNSKTLNMTYTAGYCTDRGTSESINVWQATLTLQAEANAEKLTWPALIHVKAAGSSHVQADRIFVAPATPLSTTPQVVKIGTGSQDPKVFYNYDYDINQFDTGQFETLLLMFTAGTTGTYMKPGNTASYQGPYRLTYKRSSTADPSNYVYFVKEITN